MRLLKEFPQEAEESLKSGDVNLSTLSQLQRFVKTQEKVKPVSKEQKQKLFENIKNKSQQECEKLFVALAPVKK